MVDSLKPRDADGLAVLAAIVFSLPELPWFAWDCGRGWLQLPTALVTTMFNGASDFIAAVPEIGAWLDEWSKSDTRNPPLEPTWANRRGIAPATVKQLAKGLESKLAGPKRRSIRFCDPRGAKLQLSVPARAALSLPPTLPVRASTIEVMELEQATRCTTPAGREVIVLTAVGDDPPALNQTLRVEYRRLRKMPVTQVSRIQVLTPDVDETGAEHEQR